MSMQATAREKADSPGSVAPTQRGVLQRKCACGGSAGPGGTCTSCARKRLKSSGQLQTKLRIGAVNDPLEHEADRVADQVMAMPASSSMTRAPLGIQRISSAPSGEDTVPASVERVLSGSGKQLMSVVRQDMERRFGHDFSQVRVHAGAMAAQSARDVNAHAYTVGQDVVFSEGRYSPQTQEGQHLLAHELTHVIQQRGTDVQATILSPSILLRSWNYCGSDNNCPPRETGELARARASIVQVGTLDSPESGLFIGSFKIGSSSAVDLSRNPTWLRINDQIAADNSRWEILGFSDCEGGVERNKQIRQRRADAVFYSLRRSARAKVDRIVGAPLSDCVAGNATEEWRSWNRSVVLRVTSTTIDFGEERIQVSRPDYVCGPNVTSQIQDSITLTNNSFSRWNFDQKENACDALDSYVDGPTAWDIVELHNNAWIHQSYRPVCATVGGSPPCGSSVQVEQDCYYAGSANYVIFGKMCKLCADYYLGIPLINTGYARFTRSAMVDLISLYKSDSGNYRESVAWAEAGYRGWPTGGTPPAGDRNNCRPLCPTPYAGTFLVHWYPNMNNETTRRE